MGLGHQQIPIQLQETISFGWPNVKKRRFGLLGFRRENFLYFWEELKTWNQSDTENYFQHTFVLDPHGNLLLDFVGRFETIQEDFNKIM